ncbi:transcriptional regulator [Actinomadura sp. NBRC 104425]|uniref:helix-turn-helix domain-containing protein n=1 Tax=Actinomadura sp. NBRC 104425 TaxID=3032204 RepID=UPI0024A0223D|nr:helix-turn-helix transcriptional regulator [Actinomadura sp. NBRC 104425]GLZ11651.1 transcriptional regulator [Actinomadura sp. NBRC 104425]
MSGRSESSGERAQLAAELRLLRRQAGISGRELASGIEGMSQSKVSRIESGDALPTLPQVERWADLTGAAPERKASLVRLAERAFTEVHTWRASLRNRPHRQDEAREREARARVTRTFQPALVPGLLQTAEYARQVFGLSPLPQVRKGVAAAVAARMDRQLALYEQDKRFEFLITEGALRWCPGPDARALLLPQWDRVVSLSTLGNVSLGIIPAGRQALAIASHGFVIYEGDDADDAYVSVEAIHAGLTAHDAESVGIYRQTWSALTRMAVFGDDARGVVARLAADLRAPE